MAEPEEDIDVSCPDIKDLVEVETNLTCPVNGCTKTLPNSSALRMHLVKSHKTTPEMKEYDVFEKSVACQNKVKKKIVYCCPVDACTRGRNSGRHFHRLAHVKQHYMTVHGEKKFTCQKCEKKFGRNDVCLRHEKSCGMVFPCSCGVQFNSRTSMLTHARRNAHHVPVSGSNERNEGHLNEKNRKLASTVASQPVCISFTPVLSKGVSTAVRPLKPKKVFSDMETQTEQPCCFVNKGLSLTQEAKYSLSNEGSTLTENDEKGVTVDIQLERADIDSSCKYTQTAEVGYLQPGFMTDEHFDVDDFTIDNEDFKGLAHSQTQTNWELAFENFPLFEDNETQTLESFLGLDPSSVTMDCATQTKNILDEIFSVDTETQTLMPAINFDEAFGAIHCGTSMDGQTQTLPWKDFVGTESTSLDIFHGSTSNVETQTLHYRQSENVEEV